MKKKAYIACSYQNRTQYQLLIESIRALLLSKNWEVNVPVFDFSEIDPHDYQSIMDKSFNLLKNSTLLIAEASEKNVGVGIEIGYAKASHIPIIYLQQEGTEISTTIKGTVETHIVYSSTANAIQLISDLIV